MVIIPCVNAQNISDLGTGKIVELESVQSGITGTFIVASMERMTNNSTKVLIHRSTDKADTWSVVGSIIPNVGNSEIPDPVVTSDTLGNFYLALMRVNNNITPSLLTVDVEVYKSLDDGQTWSLAGIPHFSDSIADYPQLIAKNNGVLFLTYSYMRGFPAINNSTLTFKKSTDGGASWSSPTFLGSNSIKCIGADITEGYNNTLLISVGSIDSSYVYCYTSHDFGNSWGSQERFSISNGETGHITKPLTNPNFDFYGILSHKPHQDLSSIFYHSFINGNHFSQLLDTGSYAQGYITDNGVVHVVYNKITNNNFEIKYTYSTDNGLTFEYPVTLYNQNYSASAHGEYQSLLYGNDSLFYLTFCDWSDNSRAKTLVFEPQITLSSIERFPMGELSIYPNPVSDIFSLTIANTMQLTGVKIINLRGQIEKEWHIQNKNSLINFDISHLDNDMYLVVIENENKIWVEKIIKH